MREAEIWDAEVAARYDKSERAMFDPELLAVTTARLAKLAGPGPVLEFAVGTGRVAVPLTRRGLPVAGLELSRPMVERLRAKIDEATLPVFLGDMQNTRAPGEYTLVYLVFNTIGNLLTQAEQVACFRNAARHLVPGGRFLIELGVPQLRSLPPGAAGTIFAAEITEPDAPGYLGIDIYDPVPQHLISHHVTFGSGRQAQIGRSPHRYIWPAELDLMGQLAGFELESRHADWAGAPFTAESTSHISVYRLAPG